MAIPQLSISITFIVVIAAVIVAPVTNQDKHSTNSVPQQAPFLDVALRAVSLQRT